MAQWVKVLAAKPNNPNSTPKNTYGGRETNLPQVVL